MKNLLKNPVFVRPSKKLLILLVFFFIFSTVHAQDKSVSIPLDTEKLTITAPHISYDGTRMIFNLLSDEGEAMYEAGINEAGELYDVKKIQALIFPDSVKVHIGAGTYNQSMSAIYLSMAFDEGDHDLYVMHRRGNDFSKPEKLQGEVNSDAHEFDPCVSPDGKVLYFVRNPEEGYSSMFVCGKLYESQADENGWRRPSLLPSPVNENCERSPRIAPDGKTLYFSSVRDDLTKGADLLYTKKIGRGVWLNPVPIFPEQAEGDEIFPSVTATGDKLYYLSAVSSLFNTEQFLMQHAPAYDFRPEKTVVLSGRVSDKQSKLSLEAKVEVQDPNNSLVLFSFQTEKETGKYRIYLPFDRRFKIAVKSKNYSTAYYYVDRDDFGSKDLFEKDIELFSEAELLLNVFDADIAEPLEAEIKVTDLNTGDPISVDITSGETGRYILTLPLGRAYRITARKEFYDQKSLDLDLTGIVQFDRFEKDTELKIQTGIYELQLTDAKSGSGIEAFVEIKNLTTGEVSTQKVKTDADGKVKLQLREGEEYEINVTPKGYAFYSVNVSLSDKREDNKTVAKLEPLEKETKIKLNRIFFEFNSADLNAASYDELDRVVKLLENNPDIKIEISAHTDDVGSEKYNLKLSDRRARSVVDYITEKGIAPDVLIAKGYGESQPAYTPADDEANRKKNRRVEMRIVETD